MIQLDKEKKKICTAVLLWGNTHLKMPMGIACTPDMFQSIMTEVLGNLDYIQIYIDNILCLQEEGETEKKHMEN